MDDKQLLEIKDKLHAVLKSVRSRSARLYMKIAMDHLAKATDNCEESVKILEILENCKTEYTNNIGEVYVDLDADDSKNDIIDLIYKCADRFDIDMNPFIFDIIRENDESKIYFFRSFILKEIDNGFTISIPKEDGKSYVPIDVNYLDMVKRVTLALRDDDFRYKIESLLDNLVPVALNQISDHPFVSAICNSPEFDSLDKNLLDNFIDDLKKLKAEEKYATRIRATRDILKIMSFGKFTIEDVCRMIDIVPPYYEDRTK